MNANKPGVTGVVTRTLAVAALAAAILGCAPPQGASYGTVQAAPVKPSSGVDYFPSGYANQAQHAEEHIQAF